MTDLSVVYQIGSDRDPAGFRYALIESVEADCGAVSYVTPQRPMMGATTDTGRTVHPGDRVDFRCQGSDPYGRELNWWLHSYNNGRHPEIRGGQVEMTWTVHPDSAGDRSTSGWEWQPIPGDNRHQTFRSRVNRCRKRSTDRRFRTRKPWSARPSRLGAQPLPLLRHGHRARPPSPPRRETR